MIQPSELSRLCGGKARFSGTPPARLEDKGPTTEGSIERAARSHERVPFPGKGVADEKPIDPIDRSIAPLALILVAGCSGPHQKAGQQQDKAAAVAQGQPYSGDGPNERIGKAVDRADRAAQQARKTAADALTTQGEAVRRQADVSADRLEERALAIRAEADQRGNVFDNQAKEQVK